MLDSPSGVGGSFESHCNDRPVWASTLVSLGSRAKGPKLQGVEFQHIRMGAHWIHHSFEPGSKLLVRELYGDYVGSLLKSH